MKSKIEIFWFMFSIFNIGLFLGATRAFIQSGKAYTKLQKKHANTEYWLDQCEKTNWKLRKEK